MAKITQNILTDLSKSFYTTDSIRQLGNEISPADLITLYKNFGLGIVDKRWHDNDFTDLRAIDYHNITNAI